MKGGHGDNYYDQMVANIRRFKGARPNPRVEPRTIAIDGRFDDWAAVAPEFLDAIGDPVRRDHRGWGKGSRYVNQTARNDFVASKVGVDAENVYFYVKAAEKLTDPAGPGWMLLFIDTDGNPATGWLGYDVAVNRKVIDGSRTTVERNVGGQYEWGSPAEVPFRAVGDVLELAIPRAALGPAALPAALDFKWADHIRQTGDWSDFTLNGDAAPDDRFNYRAALR